MKELSSWGGNGERVLDGHSAARKCPACGRYTHPWEDAADLRKRVAGHYDQTVDWIDVISPRFKALLERHDVRNVAYRPLSNGHFFVRPQEEIMLDFSLCEIRVGPTCTSCLRPTSFLGKSWLAKPLEGEREIGPMEMVRSSQEFISGPHSHPMILVGDDLAALIKVEKFKRVYIYDLPRRLWPDDPPLS